MSYAYIKDIKTTTLLYVYTTHRQQEKTSDYEQEKKGSQKRPYI